MDQPPVVPSVSEVRYAKEQDKQNKKRAEERRRSLTAEMRRKTLETKQNK